MLSVASLCLDEDTAPSSRLPPKLPQLSTAKRKAADVESGAFIAVNNEPVYMGQCADRFFIPVSPSEAHKRRKSDEALSDRTYPSSAYVPPVSQGPAHAQHASSAVERAIECPSGSTVACRVWGDVRNSTRRVLCVHGWLDNSASFETLAPVIASTGACVVSMDIPGHGHSSWKSPSGGYYLWDMLDDLLGVVDDLDWPTFTAIGHSTGGHLLTSFAGTFPSRVTELLLLESIGPAIQFSPSDEAAEMASFIRRRRALNTQPEKPPGAHPSQPLTANRRTRVYASFEDAARARCKGFTTVSITASRMICERGLIPVFPTSNPATDSTQPGGQQKKGISGEVAYQWRTDPRLTLWGYLFSAESTVRAMMRATTARVLCVVGERSGVFNLADPRFTRRLAAFKDPTTASVPGGSHHAHLEEETAGVVADLCLRFLGWR
ncbi:hypothetical protein HKX48_008217 [Thoreauomyces humboldtii]|nr:hypothetical protein HKX48_008217 [Thoreauomyces humboldtii]